MTTPHDARAQLTDLARYVTEYAAEIARHRAAQPNDDRSDMEIVADLVFAKEMGNLDRDFAQRKNELFVQHARLIALIHSDEARKESDSETKEQG